MSTTGLSKHKLAMVDLDGTLVFTREANHRAYDMALREVGYSLSAREYAERCNGRSYRDFLPEILGAGNPDIERVHDRKIALYAECLKAAELNEALLDVLRGLKPTYLLALVTTASRPNVDGVLRHFGLEDFFDLVVTQEDVKIAKPDPSCYTDLIGRFGVRREDCPIFEDSASGVAAALASGCQTMVIRREAPL